MLKSIKREFLLNRNSLWQSLAVLGGAWLLGEALSLCIMYFAHEEEYFSLGTVFAAIMLVMFGVIFALYYFSCGYEQALTMSCTRRRFLFGMFVTVCLQLLCLVGGIVVLTLLDRGLYLLLFRGMPIDGPDLLQPEALRWAWVILPAVNIPLASSGEVPSDFLPSKKMPPSIGPPLIKIAGTFNLAAAINIPGTILSQLASNTTPSSWWA